MAYIFITIFILSAWHFVYDGILLPSFRLELRYKLYALRDRLRMLKCDHDAEISDEVFNNLQESIVSILHILPGITVSLLMDVQKEFRADETLKRRIEARRALLRTCKVKEVHEVKAGIYGITTKALILNTGGWLPLLIVPIVVGFIVAALIQLGINLLGKCKIFVQLGINVLGKCKIFAFKLASRIAFTPQARLDSMVPATSLIGVEAFD